MTQLLKLLGRLGFKLPILKSKDWDSIFEFLEYFITVEDEHPMNAPDSNSIDWSKVKEILSLLGKISD